MLFGIGVKYTLYSWRKDIREANVCVSGHLRRRAASI